MDGRFHSGAKRPVRKRKTSLFCHHSIAINALACDKQYAFLETFLWCTSDVVDPETICGHDRRGGSHPLHSMWHLWVQLPCRYPCAGLCPARFSCHRPTLYSLWKLRREMPTGNPFIYSQTQRRSGPPSPSSTPHALQRGMTCLHDM